MREKHHKGQRHLSGKELLEKRREERELAENGEAVEIAEEMRDIAGALSITANTDGNIKKSMESILRIADRLERKGNEERNRTKVFAKSRIGKAENGNRTG